MCVVVTRTPEIAGPPIVMRPPSEIISPGASPNRPLTIGRACHKGDLLSKSAEIFDHFAFSPAAVVAICFGQK